MSSFYTSSFVRGNSVCYRGYKDGKRIHLKHEYKPFLFIDSEKGKYKTITGRPVTKKRFESIDAAKEYVETYEKVTGFNLYGLTSFEYAFLNEVFPGDIEFDPELIRVGILDIEVASDEGFPSIEDAAKEITAISLKAHGKTLVFGCGDFYNNRADVVYYKCIDEKQLLRDFIRIWDKLDLDIVTGWNVRFFDIPYLVHRLLVIFEGENLDNKLSPWGHVYRREVEARGRTNVTYEIQGIAVVDYLEIYRKFSLKNQEEYTLKYISTEELGESKIDYTEYGSLISLYRNNYQKFIEYNIMDVELVQRLEDKLKYIELVQEMAYDAKCNYNDVMTTIRPWDVIIHNYLLDRNIVVPFLKKHSRRRIVGGYVKEPKKGLSNWVVSFDLTSLYPHIIMGYNISPETYLGRIWPLPMAEMDAETKTFNPEIGELVIEKVKVPQAYSIKNGTLVKNYTDAHANCAVTANGCKYRIDFQGFMPALSERKFTDRDSNKKKMSAAKKAVEKLLHEKAGEEEIIKVRQEVSRYDNKQKTKKVQMNGLYGALLNIYNRWFNYDNGEAVTTTGQLVIKFVDMVLNQHFNETFETKGIDYVIASDTDSVYLCMEKFADSLSTYDGSRPTDLEICKAIDKYCNEVIQPLLTKAFEAFGLITQAYQQKLFMKREVIATKGLWRAKKMYILNVLNNEGLQLKTPELKMMGIETIRSSTPKYCREALKKAIGIIMNGTENDLIKYVKEFRAEFNQSPFEVIALPRSVNRIDHYSDVGKEKTRYLKGTPIQVKSAINYNYLIEKYNLKNLSPIYNGDKIKFCYLKYPNPIYDTCIASPGPLPKEFDLENYIDRELQFEKTFLGPLKSLTDVIGWNVVKVARLF